MFDADPATVLHTLNVALLRSGTTRFTTAAFLRVLAADDRETVDVSIASAGHPPALIRRHDGSVEEASASGPLLGVREFAEDALQIADYQLARGDMLILYTDGLTEGRRHGVLFGSKGSRPRWPVSTTHRRRSSPTCSSRPLCTTPASR